ncbi:MAG TPA: DUF1573 domain-containing protein [Draconibacterium sp.]|nr:DUF1573 domain-containing protein [Draconibacterium sp.]
MKRFLHTISVVFLVVALNTGLANAQPKITFEKTEHNFGSFLEAAGVQTTTFKFKNTGNAPLIVNNVKASCGCTTPKWTRDPIAPNGSGEITVSYDPKNRPGAFTKSVTVGSNAENSTVNLTISGQVQQREKTLAEKYPREIGTLRAESNHISFAQLKQSAVETKELELINDTDKPVKVELQTVPAHLTAKVTPETIPAKGKGILSVSYNAKLADTYGFASHRIYLSLDGSKDYKNSIGVSATIEEDFSQLTPEQLANAPVAQFNVLDFDFGDMKQGDKKDYTFNLTNSGKSDLQIRNVRSSCGCTAVAPSKKVVAPGETVPIKVTFDSRGKRGRQSKSITVITNDPKNPTSTLRISCNVNADA